MDGDDYKLASSIFAGGSGDGNSAKGNSGSGGQKHKQKPQPHSRTQAFYTADGKKVSAAVAELLRDHTRYATQPADQAFFSQNSGGGVAGSSAQQLQSLQHQQQRPGGGGGARPDMFGNQPTSGGNALSALDEAVMGWGEDGVGGGGGGAFNQLTGATNNGGLSFVPPLHRWLKVCATTAMTTANHSNHSIISNTSTDGSEADSAASFFSSSVSGAQYHWKRVDELIEAEAILSQAIRAGSNHDSDASSNTTATNTTTNTTNGISAEEGAKLLDAVGRAVNKYNLLSLCAGGDGAAATGSSPSSSTSGGQETAAAACVALAGLVAAAVTTTHVETTAAAAAAAPSSSSSSPPIMASRVKTCPEGQEQAKEEEKEKEDGNTTDNDNNGNLSAYSFFTFTEEDYAALTSPHASGGVQSVSERNAASGQQQQQQHIRPNNSGGVGGSFAFDFAAAQKILALYERYGSFLLVADRWSFHDSTGLGPSSSSLLAVSATGTDEETAAAAATAPFFFSSRGRDCRRRDGGGASVFVSTAPSSSSPLVLPSSSPSHHHNQQQQQQQQQQPCVEDICAEYQRVTQGVMLLRVRRLQAALLTAATDTGNHNIDINNSMMSATGKSGPPSAAANKKRPRASSLMGDGNDARQQQQQHQGSVLARVSHHPLMSLMLKHPFLSAFSEEELLAMPPPPAAAAAVESETKRAKPELEGAEEEDDEEEVGRGGEGGIHDGARNGNRTATTAAATVAKPAPAALLRALTTPASPAPGTTTPQTPASASTAGWYASRGGEEERRRRWGLSELLAQESAVNVPYQRLAAVYLSLVPRTAHALRRLQSIVAMPATTSTTMVESCGHTGDDEDRTEADCSSSASSFVADSGLIALFARDAPELFDVAIDPLPGVDPALLAEAEKALPPPPQQRQQKHDGNSNRSGGGVLEESSTPPQQQPVRRAAGRSAKATAASIATAAAAATTTTTDDDNHNDGTGEFASTVAEVFQGIPITCRRLLLCAQAGLMLPPQDPAHIKAAAAVTDVTSMPSSGDKHNNTGSNNVSVCMSREEEQQLMRVVTRAGVCNRATSALSDGVLLTLPSSVPRLHREVEQELEKYLWEDATALMAGAAPVVTLALVPEVRVVYTQNVILRRLLTRLEHLADAVGKIEAAAADAAGGGGGGSVR